MLALRNPLESGLKAISPHAVNFGEAAGRLPNTTLFAVEGMKAETAVIGFDLEGMAVSSGAACSSGKVQSSHVLAATEICARARRGAREPGLEHREADIERFLAAWRRLASALSRGRHLNGCIGERFTTVRTVKRPTWVTGRGQIRARTHVHHARWIFWRRPLVKAREFFT
jgi:cysteine sulfinate desulfinase/cysteine desulfurase-like protein